MSKATYAAQQARWAARRKMIQRLHTQQGLTFEQIGTRLGISKQRVGQIIAAQQ